MRVGATSLTKYRFVIAQCVLVLCVTLLSTGLQNGSVRAQDPSAGATVDMVNLSSWKNRNGRTLFEVMKQHSLAMMVLLDPKCGACTNAKDSLLDMRERTEKANIKYFVLMIPTDSEASKYFAYADSLKLDAEVFVWSNTDAKPPASLVTMVAPAHFLLSSEGLITEKWTGIPQNFEVLKSRRFDGLDKNNK